MRHRLNKNKIKIFLKHKNTQYTRVTNATSSDPLKNRGPVLRFERQALKDVGVQGNSFRL